MRARGVQYLLLPTTAFWLLDHYQKFREHLEALYPVIVRAEETCIIFDLRESATTPPSSKIAGGYTAKLIAGL